MVNAVNALSGILFLNVGGAVADALSMQAYYLVLAAAALVGLLPVSYTHLDVYKRQVQYNVDQAAGDEHIERHAGIADCPQNSRAHIVLDLLFVVAFRWGVFGVALATVLSQVVKMCIRDR